MSNYFICAECKHDKFLIYGTNVICDKCGSIAIYLTYSQIYNEEERLKAKE